MKKTASGVLIAMIVLAASLAAAQPEPGHGPGEGTMRTRRDPGQMMMERLKLTDQQKADMQKLRADMERAMVKTQSAIHLARIDLRQLVAAEKLDRSAIEKKVREISNLQQETKSALIDHLFSVYAMLTPEQQKTFKQHMMTLLEDGPGEGMRQRMQRPGHGMMHEKMMEEDGR
jgi:Spy/CpxP family protein refolding chaperone